MKTILVLLGLDDQVLATLYSLQMFSEGTASIPVYIYVLNCAAKICTQV
jgi:hypothetical protein